MIFPRLTVPQLAAFCGLLLLFSLLSCDSDNTDKEELQQIPFALETPESLKGVRTDSIPFTDPPTDFSKVEVDAPLLVQAIKAYESDDLQTCSNALGSYFGKAGFSSLDEMLGYVVAAYGALELYESAAREVLKRDQRRQPWNYAMKLDLAICLRNYAKKYGLEEGVALTERLKKEFGNKLVSPILMVLPRAKMTILHEGILISNDIWWDKNKFQDDILSFMDRFPNDAFIDHAYYFTGQPEKALEANPKGLLRDVLLYNIGHDCIKKLSQEERRLIAVERQVERDYISDRPFYLKMLEYVDLEDLEKATADKAYQYFKKYVEEFPDRPHADDAAYWLAWLEVQYKRFDEAIAWTKKARTLGNKDYHKKYGMPARLESEMTPFLNTKQLEAISINTEAYSYKTEKILINLVDRLPYKEAIKLLENPKYQPYEAKALYHLTKREYRDLAFENALEAAQLVAAKRDGRMENISFIIQNIQGLIDLEEVPKSKLFTKVASGLKNYFKDRKMTFQFIDNALEKFGDQEDLSTLLYLKTVLLKDSNPAKVEAVVEEMLARYTASKLCDDALAELIYIQSMILPDLPKAEANLERMFSLYPNGNALDNAMNWIARAYFENRHHIKNGAAAKEKAKYYYQRIRQEFPMTRFAGYAMQNLRYL